MTPGEGCQAASVREQGKRRSSDVSASTVSIGELCACAGSQVAASGPEAAGSSPSRRPLRVCVRTSRCGTAVVLM